MSQNLSLPRLLVKILIIFAILIVISIGSIILWRQQTALQSIEVSPQPVEEPVRALVMPHHDLILNLFQSFYNAVPETQKSQVQRVILLSPNHFQTESLKLKTKAHNFTFSPEVTVKINQEILETLTSNGVAIDEPVFKTEHGVFLHLPFIAKNFPNATVSPILITRNIPQSDLDKLITMLTPYLNDPTTLLLISTDFSHYLPYAAAQLHDEQTLNLVQESQPDQVLKLSDDNLDCPGCLYVLMKLMNIQKVAGPTVIFHSNSAKFLNLTAGDQTTSYFVMKW